jgi:arylsulfatase A-like enzyme
MRNYAQFLTPLLLLLFPEVFKVAAAEDRPMKRPNIILFLIDDQNQESIGAFGGKAYTPNLDRMAAEGIKFTRAYVSSAVCTPSRYSWLTGRYAGCSTSKLYDEACGGPDKQGFVNFNMALEPDGFNIARVLRDAGYATGITGKFHLESERDFHQFYSGPDGFRPIARDAEDSATTSELFAHNERVARRYLENLGFTWAKHIYRENMAAPYNHHNPEWTVATALEFIEANRQRPFYLHITPTLLHGGEGSWRRSMDFPLHSGAGLLKELPAVMTPRDELLKRLAENGFNPNSPTAGEAWIDDALGAVLKKLDQLRIAENTLIVFAPDHGRDGKGSLFSYNGTAIPMIARWPERIPAGQNCDELVQNIDWAPTAFDVAAASVPDGYHLHGRSLTPLFATGKAADWRDHLYFEMGHARSVTTKDWSYIAVRYPKDQVEAIKKASVERLPRLMSYIGRLGIGTRGAARPGFWDGDQLYDLRSDPRELKNLASEKEHNNRLIELRAMLTSDTRTVGRPFGEFVPGGNATPGGQIDKQIAQVKELEISGKTVVVPSEPKSPVPATKKRRSKAK